MSKKNFTGGLGSLLGEDVNSKVGRPTTSTKEIKKSSQEGTKQNETRATFIINEHYLEQLKAIAYWERLLIKDVVNMALEDAINKYISENGVIKPIAKG